MKRLPPPSILILIVVITFALFAAGCGSSTDDEQVASLDGQILTRSHLNDLLPSGDATVATRIADVVSNWLSTRAMELEVASRGEPVSAGDVEDGRDFVDTVAANSRTEDAESLALTYALSLAVGRWAEAEAASRPDPEPPDYLCANHILLSSEEDALATLERLEAGEDFAELAIELSIGPSGPRGGDLDCAVRGQFVPEFEEAAYGGEAGEVVGPVQTDFGFHLIEIESVGPATGEFHPDAAPAVLDALLGQGREAIINVVIFELDDAARVNYGDTVSVDPSIGTFDPETFEITAP